MERGNMPLARLRHFHGPPMHPVPFVSNSTHEFQFFFFPLMTSLNWSFVITNPWHPRTNFLNTPVSVTYVYIVDFVLHTLRMGSSGSTSGKESACQCSRQRRLGFDSWVRKIPWRRASIHSSILARRVPWTEEPGRLQYIGHQESDMTEVTLPMYALRILFKMQIWVPLYGDKKLHRIFIIYE